MSKRQKKNQANSQWCAKLFSVAVVRLCPIVNWVWNKNPIYFKLMASFFSAPLRFFNSSHTHISSFEITFLERRNILFIGEPGISVSFPTSLFKPKNTETLLFLRLLIDKFAYLRDYVLPNLNVQIARSAWKVQILFILIKKSQIPKDFPGPRFLQKFR